MSKVQGVLPKSKVFDLLNRFATLSEARTRIFNYIETFYNRTRLHSSFANLSPINYESQLK